MEAGLPIPAYGQLLKLSHAFNILDARGAVGVTDRAACFGAMRSLACQIAGAPSGGISHVLYGARCSCQKRQGPVEDKLQ